MFSKPSTTPKQASDPEAKWFEIDLSRSVPPDLKFADATFSMIQDWNPFPQLMKQNGGPEMEEIDEVSLIKISEPMQAGTSESFYQGNWQNERVVIAFRRLTNLNRRKLLKERDLFALSQSPRVLQLFATCLDFSRLTGNFIVQSFKCSLRSFYSDFVPRTTTAKFMIQLTEGLTFIHEKNIVLRNLCPENILILNNGNLVISHFADAIMLTESGVYKDKERIGLPEYSALETLQSNDGENSYHFSKSSDVFALGSILFEIWTNNSYTACPRHLIREDYFYEFYIDVLQNGRPFTKKHHQTCKLEFAMQNGVQLEKLEARIQTNMAISCPDGLADSFVDLFSQMLIFRWTTRITAANILLSQAFNLLHQNFNATDTDDNGMTEYLPITDFELEMEYSVEEKLRIRSKLPTFFGFSKMFKRPTEFGQSLDSPAASSDVSQLSLFHPETDLESEILDPTSSPNQTPQAILSVPNQYCDRMGVEVIDEFNDIVAASPRNAPGSQETQPSNLDFYLEFQNTLSQYSSNPFMGNMSPASNLQDGFNGYRKI